MLKMGIPIGGVRQALQKEGKDPNVVDMDPEKSYASQAKGKGGLAKDAGPPLKDDPEYNKFFKVTAVECRPFVLSLCRRLNTSSNHSFHRCSRWEFHLEPFKTL